MFAARLAANSKHPTDVDAVIGEATAYASHLAAPYAVDTPDDLLNAAFIASIYNMEYIWNGKAWMEGLHWWVAPWCMNYQLSAATVLGQYGRVQKVLRLVGHVEPHPAPGLTGALKAMFGHIDIYRHGTEDGLPYYLYQLIQYFQATGDRETVLDVWEPVIRGIDAFFKVRLSKNGLIDFHLGCNMLLYQADHLSLPGDAASPSLIVAGVLEGMASLAVALEKPEQAEQWKKQADALYQNLIRLWDEKQGDFGSHIDLQGVRHMALYYTDLCFAMLYTTLPDDIRQKSLDKLYETMMFETEDHRLLMRVGRLKPTIFGNDNVMPTQMCEAARAFYLAGEYETATRLLQSVAYAATIYTESPGSFPERMDDDGKGEANYMFGNPIGSFCYAFVSGLFGIGLRNEGKTLACEPAFPYEWDHASITLPYASLHFERERSGSRITDCYTIVSQGPRILQFGTSPDTVKIYQITVNDHEGTVYERFGSPRCEALAKQAGTRFTVTVRYSTQQAKAVPQRLMPQENPISLSGKRLPLCRKLKAHPIPLQSVPWKDTIALHSAWRSGEYSPNLTPYMSAESQALVEGIPFLIEEAHTKPYPSPKMAILQFADSDPYTNELIHKGPHMITLPLKGTGSMLALLYISECRSRNTGCEGGSLRVRYRDGCEERTPLVVGETLDTIFSHFAVDTIGVCLPAESGEPGQDSAHLYLLPLQKDRELQDITFSIELADVTFGLMGITLLH